MTISKTPEMDAKEALVRVVEELSPDRMADVLEFALSMKAQQMQEQSDGSVQPVQCLEDLWGDFWPEDESVDDFIETVQCWRREDSTLHRDLR